MTTKILFIDDEALSLKYFERLVSPLAPVLTASSVAQGRALLDEHAADIGVLVTDQRMPGEQGNELLRYARERHPNIVRMLTTAYSELGEAIDAINSGEIYRYITKPWDLPRLQADLRNALELAALRGERDRLLREKMMVQQLQLLAQRAGQLPLLCAGQQNPPQVALAIELYLHTAAEAGCPPVAIDWSALGFAELVQAEAERAVDVAQRLATWRDQFASVAPAQALEALARAVGASPADVGQPLRIVDVDMFTGLLAGPVRGGVTDGQIAWLAWLLRFAAAVQVRPDGEAWSIAVVPQAMPQVLPGDWLAASVERLIESAQGR
jgi:two-component system probable response regulator PhcQ